MGHVVSPSRPCANPGPHDWHTLVVGTTCADARRQGAHSLLPAMAMCPGGQVEQAVLRRPRATSRTVQVTQEAKPRPPDTLPGGHSSHRAMPASGARGRAGRGWADGCTEMGGKGACPYFLPSTGPRTSDARKRARRARQAVDGAQADGKHAQRAGGARGPSSLVGVSPGGALVARGRIRRSVIVGAEQCRVTHPRPSGSPPPPRPPPCRHGERPPRACAGSRGRPLTRPRTDGGRAGCARRRDRRHRSQPRDRPTPRRVAGRAWRQGGHAPSSSHIPPPIPPPPSPHLRRSSI
jgi:hypothetical protein